MQVQKSSDCNLNLPIVCNVRGEGGGGNRTMLPPKSQTDVNPLFLLVPYYRINKMAIVNVYVNTLVHNKYTVTIVTRGFQLIVVPFVPMFSIDDVGRVSAAVNKTTKVVFSFHYS